MIRTLTYIILFILGVAMIQAQSCLPEGIVFTSQAQITNFPINYPACTEIEGSVEIQGNDIVTLSGLNNISSIGGDLLIFYNPSLTSLSGLDDLSFVGGNLSIGDRNFSGQPWNPVLSSIVALSNLTTVGGDLEIYNNNSLSSLNGLTSLNSVGGALIIGGNNQLSNLAGLGNLESVGGSVLIDVNNILFNLSGLDHLSTIGGSLGIYHNSMLENLSGLQGLQLIGGNLWIERNDVLTSLYSLRNLAASSIKDVIIFNNESLASCEVKSLCEYLESPNGMVQISDNASGCNSQAEVELDCEDLGVKELSELTIKIYPNPCLDLLYVEYSIPYTLYFLLELYSIDGVRIARLEEERLASGPQKISVDVSDLPAGMYVVEVTVESQKIRQKLLVK